MSTEARASIVDAQTLPWRDTPDPGLRLKPVRYDDATGAFLGLVSFAPLARSGLHQHQGVATSFVVDGALTDYQGAIGLHQAGINLRGATHDAMAYQNTLLVSRLEAPVYYPRERLQLTGLHAGSRHADITNPAPEVPPDLNITVDVLPRVQTGVPGLVRQTIFDYAGTGSAHRFVQLALQPGTRCPPWRAGAPADLWVRGGLLEVNGEVAHANCFVTIPAGARVALASTFGALLLAWAEGPEQWEPGAEASRSAALSLFGF
jgi:hypothetical protein